MEHYEFKAKLPVDHVMHIVSMVREGKLISNIGDALQCAGSAVGELGAFINSFRKDDDDVIGQSAGPQYYQGVPVDQMDIVQVCDALEEALQTNEQQVIAANSPAAINPLVLALLKKLLELLLDNLL